MIKYLAVVIAGFILTSNCLADTFVNKSTGKSFNGYVVNIKKTNTIQVRREGNNTPVYIDLQDYNIERNSLGRKNKVFTFSIDDSIDLEMETQAIEQGIAQAANQGPLFILIEVDTLGGRIDLAQRICAAIQAADNCTTIAFVSGKKFGGAFSAGAVIALACEKVCMKNGTSIGAASLYAKTADGPESLDDFYGKVVSEKITSAWSAFCTSVAQKNGRPGLLVKAMIDKEVGVIEVVQDGKRMFVTPENKTENQKQITVWNTKGSLLTLTADEALKTGLADKLVSSRQEVFQIFNAEKASEIKSRAQLTARREFQVAKNNLTIQLNAIDKQKKQADILLKQIDELRGSDNNSNRYSANGRDNHQSYGYDQSNHDIDRVRQVSQELTRLNNQLIDIVNSLIDNYEKAISITNKTPDLEYYKDSLQEGLTKAQGVLFQVSNRPLDRNYNRNNYQ
jgi:ATP-dependent protease ClpP protease subunit